MRFKIIVTGALQSGKSSFIQTFDTKAMNIEAQGKDKKFYTVGMDLATLTLKGFDVYLFGTPGLSRMQVMRDVLTTGADGIIFLFDATSPEKDKDAMDTLEAIKKTISTDIPIIFLANKSDEANARTPKEIRDTLKLSKNDKIFQTSTLTGEGVEESLDFIVHQIHENYITILKIIQEYHDDLEGLGKKLKLNKNQIRDLLYSLELKRLIEIDRENRSIKVKEGLIK